jgi:RimJ/RimL family protein N-acetyltransferase
MSRGFDMDSVSVSDQFVELVSEHVTLKRFLAADISDEYVSWLNDPNVVKYSNQRFFRHTRETCKRYLDGFEGTSNLFIKIQRKIDGLSVGTMTAYVSTHHQTVNVGILVGPQSLWGLGIGQEAWSLLVEWLLHQETVRKVTAGTMRCNTAMIRLMEKSGMTLEAVRPDQELLEGIPQDLVYYGKFSAR